MLKQLEVIFTGRVQGVGFRYTVDRIARHFPVAGYVRNMPDGTVCVLAEGEEVVLKDFLQAVCESPMQRNIREVKQSWADIPAGHFKEFGIAY